MIDSDGFRPNVGIVISNGGGKVFWARRIGQNAWQFPQGGIKANESAEQALFRELEEEVGLRPEHVDILGATDGWLRYWLPRHLVRRHRQPVCIGQKQVWFLLRLRGCEEDVCLDASGLPEFDRWMWLDYWEPMRRVVFFKRRVYGRALTELAPLIFSDSPCGGPPPEAVGTTVPRDRP